MSTATGSGAIPSVLANGLFDQLESALQQHFQRVTAGKDSKKDGKKAGKKDGKRDSQQGRVPLFRTSATGLWHIYLNAFPAELRQEHTCSACRKFIERYGSLVAIEPNGKSVPVLWDPESAPAEYADAIRALAQAVSEAPVSGVFLSQDEEWGVAQVGPWRHFAVKPAAELLYKPSLTRTAGQAMAEKHEEYGILLRGLAEFPFEVVRKAHSLLTTGALFRSESCIGVAKWLVELHKQRSEARNERSRDNLTWVAVAEAPPGYCHVRSSMIGTLLEDLVAELPFAQIKAKFDAKMHPLQYQRPTAAPSAGNIARAEKIVAQLKAEGSLARRFATLADIKPLWTPPSSEDRGAEKKGVFSHLKSKQQTADASLELPAITITWDKFARTVLPTAQSIEYFVPSANQMYMAMVTASDPEAPPILQWDLAEARNPVSWYFYVSGSPPARWNLKPNVWHPVTAVCLQPTMWDPNRTYAHQGEKVFFLLKDAKDLEYTQSCGFFPEFLKSEFHEIRSTLEAYAQSAKVEGKDAAECCGIGLQKGATWNHSFRVTSQDGMRATYKLDRWD